MRLSRGWQFLQANGVYIFGAKLLALPLGLLRNFLIGRKLGVKKIKIGPYCYLRGLSSIRMGEDFAAEDGLWLEALTRYNDQTFSPTLIIGDHVRVSRWVHIAATNLVQIGDNVLMGSKVMITDHNHGQYSQGHTPPDVPPASRPLDDDRQVIIGSNVWLADGVVVVPGCSIGEGSVIGANSIVRGNIPPFSIAAGAPAKVIKRFDFDSRTWTDVG